MYNSLDSSDIFPASGSRLLSESPILPSSFSLHTGLGGDDLSISELSLADKTPTSHKPFSLLATPSPTHLGVSEEDDDPENNMDDDENAEQRRRHKAKLREEKLQSDIFILRKLNASFAMFNEALHDTGSANQRVALQLEQTDALLNKYIGILSKSEEFSRLIFDQQWQGAEADEQMLEHERLETIEKARRDAEEKALAKQQEDERRRREEQEKIEEEKRERAERERNERLAVRGNVRGVRGTRASVRGITRGTRSVPGGTILSRGRPAVAVGTGAGGTKLPVPSTGIRGSSSTSAREVSRRS